MGDSREIKFRAWTNGGEEHNFAHRMDYNIKLGSDFELNTLLSTINNWGVVMQFTGSEDIAGRDIYEGDVLHGSYGIPGRTIKAPVVFEDGGFFAITKGHSPERCLIPELIEHIGGVEIIGNIYENPELIND